ncbi:MAG TPA: hypothetical protein VL172_16355 [Kofleriaceae bacterium]|nr:hypothetical protein [Kofleriaceae bacterium]
MRTIRTLALTVTVTATALSGCVQQVEEHPIDRALPTADGVAIKVPGQNAAATFAIGDVAEYYRVTRDVSRTLNGGAAWVLILVHAVVQYPPTTVDGNVYTWGPGSNALDPADWRLTVVDNEDGTYDWDLDGRNKTVPGSDFETVISGHAVPGEVAYRGSGSFVIDFDAGERVNPDENDARGTVAVDYDLNNIDGTPATLTMAIDSVQPDENGIDQPVSFDYAYAENLDGSGDLQFAIHGDLDDEGALMEDALIRSRWLATGAGRGDAMVQGGDLGALTVTASECWDTTFRRVYYTDSVSWQPTEGDAGACAFADADLPEDI